MLSNKLFSFKPVVIFFFQKEGVGVGGGPSFQERFPFHFADLKKKNGCDLEPRNRSAIWLSLLPDEEARSSGM